MKFSIFGEHLYTSLQDEVIAYSPEELKEVFFKLETYQKQGLFCVGYLTYEAYQESSSSPLLYFGVFSQKEPFSPQPTRDVFYPHHCQFIDEASYIQKISQLKKQIAYGNTYQGNFTTFLEFQTMLNAQELFNVLLQRQNTPYKAFLPTPFGEILSFSPELFFQIKDRHITTRPMKGTMPRGTTPQQDEANRLFLSRDVKNRSENVMIVDLLRNDLSKIAQKGTLEVSKLFEVETYPTLFQMTSTITAKLKEHIGLAEVFEALFPCGSIVGAPKKITIEILRDLEQRKRGVYCGAVGLIAPESVTFSIPIRMILKTHSSCLYGVGSGIVWDSEPKAEYLELQTKMKFLYPPLDFKLLESILYTPQAIQQEFLELNQGLVFLDRHLKRLKEGAKALGVSYPQRLERELQALRGNEVKIIRILLDLQGNYKLEILPFIEEKNRTIALQPKPFKSDLSQFKTTLHKDLTFLKEHQLFDVIFYQGENLLEGLRSNLVIELEDGLFTPCLNQQGLKGICIQVLLDQGIVKERELNLEDLKRAKRIFCTNSLRGMIEVNRVEIESLVFENLESEYKIK